jgi:hypothetical protein
LARLETAAADRPPLSLFENVDTDALRERHQTLRGQVEGAIARIDSLLQSAERS